MKHWKNIYSVHISFSVHRSEICSNVCLPARHSWTFPISSLHTGAQFAFYIFVWLYVWSVFYGLVGLLAASQWRYIVISCICCKSFLPSIIYQEAGAVQLKLEVNRHRHAGRCDNFGSCIASETWVGCPTFLHKYTRLIIYHNQKIV